MTPPDITRLEAALTFTQKEALRIHREAMESGDPDPADEELSEACALVDYHVGQRTVPTAVLNGWAVDIASYKLALRLGETGELVQAQKELWEAATSSLRQVRDSKFEHSSPVTPTGGGEVLSSGGRANIFK